MGEVFEGIKVADFTWAVMGPLVTKYLADHGATVVRIESAERPCILRTTLPFKDGIPGVDRSGYFAFFNANKYSLTLNLDNPYGQMLAKKLVAWADIVVENFRPGVMEKFGLNYEDIKSINPNVIMLRSSTQGQFGRYKQFGSMGQPLSALSGFYNMTGWPYEEPLALPYAYSDWVSSKFGAVILIAALDYRRRTRKGVCIDLSQFEASLQFLLPTILNYIANGIVEERNGNAVSFASPNGVYRCKGDDRWCAITVSTDQEWIALCEASVHPEWARDTMFQTLERRKGNEDLLNKLIESWTINYEAEDIMVNLQKAGVSAGVVQNSEDIFNDKQLKFRNALWNGEHPTLGEFWHLGQPYILSETPAKLHFPSPCMGEHNEYVCTNILELSSEEFVECLEKGAFE
jgi:benzylsuccinate CoA-transferase BbsF subunit